MSKSWRVATAGAVCIAAFFVYTETSFGYQQVSSKPLQHWTPRASEKPAQGYVVRQVAEDVGGGLQAVGTILLTQTLATLDAKPQRVRVLTVQIEFRRSGERESSMVHATTVPQNAGDAYVQSWGVSLTPQDALSQRRIEIRPRAGLRWGDVGDPKDIVVRIRAE